MSGESFLTKPNKTIYMAKNIIKKITRITPYFLQLWHQMQIYEKFPGIWVVNKTMHKVDERVFEDLKNLTKIYQNILEDIWRSL